MHARMKDCHYLTRNAKIRVRCLNTLFVLSQNYIFRSAPARQRVVDEHATTTFFYHFEVKTN